MLTPAFHNKHKMGTWNSHGLMSVSQCSIQLPSGPQAPQIGADRLMLSKNKNRAPTWTQNTMFSAPPHSWITHTQTYSHQTAASREGSGGIWRRAGVRAGRQSETPPPQCSSRDKSRPTHSAPHQSGSYQTGFCSTLEHLILLTETEVKHWGGGHIINWGQCFSRVPNGQCVCV